MMKRFMAPFIKRTPKYLFSTIQGNFNFQDILMLKRVDSAMRQTLLQKEASYVLYFKSKQIFVRPDISVLDFEKTLKDNISAAYKVSIHQQTLQGEVQIASSTPLSLVLQDDFIVKVNQQENYVVLSKVDDPPVVDLIQTYPITQQPIQDYFSNIDTPQRTRVVLSNFIQRMIEELNKNNEQIFNKNLIVLIIKKIILKTGIYSKTQKQILDNQLSYLIQKEQQLRFQQQNLYNELARKEQYTLNQIYFYIFAQIAFTQYGTYMVWGWGVMEPVTFLIGVVDLMIAYSFWMRTTRSYKFENVLDVAVKKNLEKQLSSVQFSQVIIFIKVFHYKEELNDVQRMIEYLKFKEMLFSTDIDAVLNVIEGVVDGKITKEQEKKEDDD